FDFERWRIGLVEHAKLDDVHLDFAGDESRVLVRAAALDHTAHPDDPFATERLREVVGLFRGVAVAFELGVEDELGDALAVAKVDENAASVVSVARHPAEEHNLFRSVGGTELGAVVRSFELVDESGHFYRAGNLARLVCWELGRLGPARVIV